MSNLFKEIPEQLPEELIETICSHEHVRIERIVSRGHSSPDDFWYDQAEHEWVIVLQGAGILEFAEPAEEITLSVGDYTFIPAHRRHRVKRTSSEEETIWLAIFFR